MASNNNTLNTTVSVFASTNFCAWQQSMGDFLKSQKLWRHATGIVTHPVEAVPGAPMAAELQLQGTWDETDDFSGFNGTCSPHSLTKVEWECGFPPLVPVQVSKPVTLIVANFVCAAIVDNVVASLSQMTLEDIPATVPLVECISTPTVMPSIILGLNQAYKVQVQSSSVQYQKSPKSLFEYQEPMF